MYDELVKRMRKCATEAGACKTCELDSNPSCTDVLMEQAADAIEELQKRVPKRPHGRLIDADALNEAMARMVPWAIADPTANAFLDGLSAAYEVIQSAPTIIPAEEGE